MAKTMRRNIVALVALLLIALIAAACGGGGSSSSTSSSTSSSSSSAGSSSDVVEVSLKNFKFNPSEIRVKVGQTVRFKNDDTVRHNVVQTTVDQAHSGNYGFEAPTLMPGDSWTYTFRTAGTYPILCNLDGHELLGMTATVIVE